MCSTYFKSTRYMYHSLVCEFKVAPYGVISRVLQVQRKAENNMYMGMRQWHSTLLLIMDLIHNDHSSAWEAPTVDEDDDFYGT